MWLLDRSFHFCTLIVTSPALLVASLFFLKITDFFGSQIGSSIFVSGLDLEMFSEGPDFGDIFVDSVMNQDNDDGGGESIYRKVYNEFFSSKDKSRRRRRSANILPIRAEPVYRPNAGSSSINRKGINVGKAYDTPKEALAEVTKGTGEDRNRIYAAPLKRRKNSRTRKNTRPPPPPYVEVGNQTYKISYSTAQRLASAIKSGRPQPPPPYLYEKYNYSANEIDNDKLAKVNPLASFFNITQLKDIGDTPIGINYKNSTNYRNRNFEEEERFKRQNAGQTTESPLIYRYSTYRPESVQFGDSYHLDYRPSNAEHELNLPHHLPYKYPYKYQHGRHAYRDDFTVPCESCEPYEDNRKKLPRLLVPWPLSIYTKDRHRPFPESTFFLFTPTILVPYIPFGLAEFSLVFGFDANYIVERFNGFKDDVFGFQSFEYLPPVSDRKKRADNTEDDFPRGVRRTNFVEDQFDMLENFSEMLSNTLAINGKACMQRLICEISEVPVNKISFMGKILHDIFVPLKDDVFKNNKEGSPFERNSVLSADYIDAETQGKNSGECFQHYGMCPFSIRSLLPKEYVHQQIIQNRIKRRR